MKRQLMAVPRDGTVASRSEIHHDMNSAELMEAQPRCSMSIRSSTRMPGLILDLE